jgi:serine O-acetyltransferase
MIKEYFANMIEEIDAVMERDPAARSRLEVAMLYSGYKAVRSYRKANWFYRHNMKFIARAISQRARHRTGVEIHPGATIGKGLFIDHGMGVVIGETAVIGDNCTIYQNVTLGGTGKHNGKRHPTLGNNVMVGSGAKVLGPFTVGDGARVAAGAVVLDAVPENATAVGVPARVVRVNGVKVNHESEELDQIHVSDPVSQELCRVNMECERMKAQLKEMQDKMDALLSMLPAEATANGGTNCSFTNDCRESPSQE